MKKKVKPLPPESRIMVHCWARFSIEELCRLPPQNAKALMQGLAAISSAEPAKEP
jgi:hypothetical protein